MGKYDDIINLEHFEPKNHKRMSTYHRAAQFSPFAALTGYDDLVKETTRITHDKIELSEYEKSLVNDKNGVLPNDREYLESLPGVGRKTANVVLSNIFNVPCIAVDTHVTRVSKRLGLTLDNDNVITIEKKLNDLFDKDNLCKIHHQLVLFGRYYCLARNPKCETCELKDLCRFKK